MLNIVFFTGQCCKKIPFRAWIAVMVFLTTYINYTTRVNMSISIVSMTGGKQKPTPQCLLEDTSANISIDATKKPLVDVSIIYYYFTNFSIFTS